MFQILYFQRILTGLNFLIKNNCAELTKKLYKSTINVLVRVIKTTETAEWWPSKPTLHKLGFINIWVYLTFVMETRPTVWMIMLIYTCLKTGSGFHNIIIVFTFLVKKNGFRYLIGELNKIFLKLKKFDFNPFHNAPLFLNYKITITHKIIHHLW